MSPRPNVVVIGLNSGSPAGDYPVACPFRDGTIVRVDIEING
ncbi:MAG TPA: hypothetical protein VFY14_13790 [Streptomyces sp.]|nr:hypothetical protein [Streptomyces sp.]